MGRNVAFNKEETVKKAMNVFWEKGYNGTSMQDLVDAMQINRSSLYNTIGGKQQLFLECIKVYFDGAVDETTKNARTEKSPLKALVAFIKDVARATVECENCCLGTKSTFEMASTDTEIRKSLKKHDDLSHALLVELVKNAIVANEIDTSEDPEILADFIFSSFTGWKQSYILHGNPIKIKKMSEYLIRNISRK